MNVLRRLVRRRLGLASAAGSVALGVGINAILLGTVASAWFDRLPFAHGTPLVTLVASSPSSPDRFELRASEVRALRSIGPPILDVGTAERWPQSFRGWADVFDGSTTTHPLVAYVTPNVLEAAAVNVPSPPNADGSVLAMVTRSYAGQLGITQGVPRTLKVDKTWVTVIGVLPADFRPPLPAVADRYFSGTTEIQLWILDQPEDVESGYYNSVISMAGDADLGALNGEIDRRMHDALPPQRAIYRYRLEPLRSAIIGERQPLFLMLLVTAAALAAMTVANLVAVMLIRLDDARRSIAIEAALGASGWRLWWLHTRESVLVTGIAGALGTVAAVFAAPVVSQLMPGLPWAPAPAWYVWLGAGAVALVCVLAVVTISAVFVGRWRSSRQFVTAEARGTARSLKSVSMLTRATVAAEIVVICVIAAPTVALNLALTHVSDRRPFLAQPQTMVVQFMISDRLTEQLGGTAPIYDRLRRKIEALPGVRGVGFSSDAPLLNAGHDNWLVGAADRRRVRAQGFAVDEAFLRALNITLSAGRRFDQRDTASSPGTAILSESLAIKLFGTPAAVGRVIDWHGSREVVGVVADARLSRADRTTAVLYVPILQQPPKLVAALVQFASAADMKNARPALASLDPEQPFDRLLSIEDAARIAFFEQTRYARLANLLAGCAIAVALLGLNFVVGYLARCRRQEIAIKQAIGIGISGMALDGIRTYGRRLLWAATVSVPASWIAVSLLERAASPLTIQGVEACALTVVGTSMVFAGAAVAHSIVFGRRVIGRGIREALAAE